MVTRRHNRIISAFVLGAMALLLVPSCSNNDAIQLPSGRSEPTPTATVDHSSITTTTPWQESSTEVTSPETSSDVITPDYWVFQAETDLAHLVGRVDGTTWTATPSADNAGFMAYGPYTTDIPSGSMNATFTARIDSNAAVTSGSHAGEITSNPKVMTIEVRDATDSAILATRDIYKTDFPGSLQMWDIILPFTAPGNGHLIEFRVNWYDNSTIWLDGVCVASTPCSVTTVESP